MHAPQSLVLLWALCKCIPPIALTLYLRLLCLRTSGTDKGFPPLRAMTRILDSLSCLEYGRDHKTEGDSAIQIPPDCALSIQHKYQSATPPQRYLIHVVTHNALTEQVT